MKYKLTKAEQETVINFDNELDTASIYTHDSRLIKKLRELRKQYPEQFILEHREHGSVTYTIPKRCVGIRPPYSEKRREQQRQEAKENGLPFMEKGDGIWEARAFLPFRPVRTVTTIPYIIRTLRKLTVDRSTTRKSA